MLDWVRPAFDSYSITLLVLTILSVLLVLASWWRRIPGPINQDELGFVNASKIHKLYKWRMVMMLFMPPVVVWLSLLAFLFPVSEPTILVLRSQSRATENEGDERWNSLWVSYQSKLSSAYGRARIVDAGVASQYAIKYLSSINNRLPYAWDYKDVSQREIIKKAALKGSENFSVHDATLDSYLDANLPNAEQDLPRWVTESVEIAVIKLLSSRFNTKGVVTQMGKRPVIGGHAWIGLQEYINIGTDNLHTLVNLVDEPDSPLEPKLLGQPYAIKLTNDSIVILSKFYIPQHYSVPIHLDLIHSGGALTPEPIFPTGEVKPLAQNTIRTLRFDLKTPHNNNEYLNLVYQFTKYKVRIEQDSNVALSINYSGPDITAATSTLARLLPSFLDSQCMQNGNDSISLKNWREMVGIDVNRFTNATATTVPSVVIDFHDVMGQYPSVWIYRSDIQNVISSYKDKTRHVDKPKLNDNPPVLATMSFRTKMSPPGPYSFQNIFLNEKPWETTYLEGLNDESTVAYSMASTEPLVWPDRFLANTRSKFLQQFDHNRGDGTISTVTRIGLNPKKEGVFLTSDCMPGPQFSSDRFFAYWTAVLRAAILAVPRPIVSISSDSISNPPPVYVLSSYDIESAKASRYKFQLSVLCLALSLFAVVLIISAQMSPMSRMNTQVKDRN